MSKIEKNEMKQIIIEQQTVLLEKSIERTVLAVTKKFHALPQAVIVAGIRRCGKSTLLRQIMSSLGDNYYYFNFEDERLLNFRAENFNDFYEALLELYGEKKIFFLDEIQNVVGWERFVRRMQDKNFKFYITGSNASLLSRELGTRLTGRYLNISLMPFSFIEFLRLKNFKPNDTDMLNTAKRAQIKKLFNEYFVKGGMPEYLQFDSLESLKKVYESIIYRDIITRYELKDERALRELCVYLFSNLSTTFSFNSLKKMLRLGSVNTVINYIQYLENSFLFFIVDKFSFSYRKQILSAKKIYCIDNAIAKALGFSFSDNLGRLLENMVFLELKRQDYDIYYHQTEDGREVDFVARKNNKTIYLIQVCWSLSGGSDVKEREVLALKKAMAEFKMRTGYILTDDEYEDVKFVGGMIKVRPVYRWLMENTIK